LARLPHRFIRDGLHPVEGHKWLGEPLRGSLDLACGRLAALQGNHVRFLSAIQGALARGLHWLFTHQGSLQTVFAKVRTDVAHRLAMTLEGVGHVRSGPGETRGIHVE
jgi:hypothetical protein